eukprot:TRINITY_DN67001_c12_g8_i1.p1 TRINITY_DN67001_c12_g8~~TRINITY_DN67001_c12_g8_i1.p1  ORF type:complete len:777 (+),score=94.08 TRINITY_DN67001_c12_g8_i1:33-2363(+)
MFKGWFSLPVETPSTEEAKLVALLKELSEHLNEKNVPVGYLAEVERCFKTREDFDGNVDLQNEIWDKVKRHVQKIARNSLPSAVLEVVRDFIHRERPVEAGPPIDWSPSKPENTNIAALQQAAGCADYPSLHTWSNAHKAEYVGGYCKDHITFKTAASAVLVGNDGENASWFPGAKMNIVDSALSIDDPNKPAILFADEVDQTIRTMSYAELAKLTNKVANGLANMGVPAGARIGICMPMTAESIAIYLGIIKGGYAAVSIADSFAPPEIQTRMNIAQSTVMFCQDAYIRDGKRAEPLKNILAAGVQQLILIPLDNDKKTLPKLRENDVLWENFLNGASDEFESVTCDPTDVSNVLFSSGTTGDPKAIPWTHLTPIKVGIDAYYHVDVHPTDVVCFPTNIGWMMGPWLIYSALLNNATMALFVGAPTGEAIGRFVQGCKVNKMGVVPSMVKRWKSTHCMEQLDWSSITGFVSTGERSDRSYLYLMWLTKFKAPVIEYCGGTEIGGGFLTQTMVQNASVACFGTPALGSDLCLLNTEGKEAAEGEDGELFLTVPSIGLSQKLLNLDHHTVFFKGCPRHPRTGQLLRRHGDQVRRLGKGFYQSEGRADDTMNLGGIKISSAELERAVNRHASVSESACIAVTKPDEGTDVLVVYIVLDAAVDAAKVDASALKGEFQQLISKNLNPLFRVFDVQIIDALPKTATQKVMRRHLRTAYMEKIGSTKSPTPSPSKGKQPQQTPSWGAPAPAQGTAAPGPASGGAPAEPAKPAQTTPSWGPGK